MKTTVNFEEVRNKNIMLLCPMLHQGGFERVCVQTARLLESYASVYVVIFDSADIAYDIKGLNVIDLKMGAAKSAIGKAFNVLRRVLAVQDLKQKLGIDVTYSFGPTANRINVLSRMSDKVWIGIRSYMEFDQMKRLERYCKNADKVLCCSRVIELRIREQLKAANTLTVYNPVDINTITMQAEAEFPTLPWLETGEMIVSMGREDDVKGYWHLIKAFSIIHKNRPGSRLLIVGDGDFKEYDNLAKDLGVDAFIHFSGMQSNPFPYIKLGNVYVLTSYHEGFPNALIEAMALDIPVIATDCLSGPREILLEEYEVEEDYTWDNPDINMNKDYGILVPNMSAEKNLNADVITKEEEKLAEVIEELLDNKEKIRRYKEAGHKRVEAFTKEHYVEQLLELMP